MSSRRNPGPSLVFQSSCCGRCLIPTFTASCQLAWQPLLCIFRVTGRQLPPRLGFQRLQNLPAPLHRGLACPEGCQLLPMPQDPPLAQLWHTVSASTTGRRAPIASRRVSALLAPSPLQLGDAQGHQLGERPEGPVLTEAGPRQGRPLCGQDGTGHRGEAMAL